MTPIELLECLACLALTPVVRRIVESASRAPQDAFPRSGLLVATVRHRWPWWLAALGLSALAGGVGWDGTALAVVLLAGTALVWQHALGPFNPWVGRWHGLERASAVALLAVAAAWPGGLIPMLIVCRLLRSTVDRTFAVGLSPTDARLAWDLLYVMGAGAALSPLIGLGPAQWLGLALATMACEYVVPGIAKLRVGPRFGWWLAHNRLDHLAAGAMRHGWGWWLGEARSMSVLRLVRRWNRPMLIATLAVELLAPLAMLSPVAAVAVLLGATAMHVGIFLSSGIAFWKWVVIDVGLAIVVAGGGAAWSVFGLDGLGLVLLAWTGSAWWLGAPRLGWADSRLSHVYRFELVFGDGCAREIPARWWAPYDLAFAQGRFGFLSERPTLVGTCGTHTRRGRELADLAARINATDGDPRRVTELLSELGEGRRDAIRAARLERFIAAFVRARASGAPRRVLGFVPGPAPHLWFGPSGRGISAVGAAAVRVSRVDWFYRDSGFVRVHEELVLEVEIEPAAARLAA